MVNKQISLNIIKEYIETLHDVNNSFALFMIKKITKIKPSFTNILLFVLPKFFKINYNAMYNFFLDLYAKYIFNAIKTRTERAYNIPEISNDVVEMINSVNSTIKNKILTVMIKVNDNLDLFIQNRLWDLNLSDIDNEFKEAFQMLNFKMFNVVRVFSFTNKEKGDELLAENFNKTLTSVKFLSDSLNTKSFEVISFFFYELYPQKRKLIEMEEFENLDFNKLLNRVFKRAGLNINIK